DRRSERDDPRRHGGKRDRPPDRVDHRPRGRRGRPDDPRGGEEHHGRRISVIELERVSSTRRCFRPAWVQTAAWVGPLAATPPGPTGIQVAAPFEARTEAGWSVARSTA